MSTGAPGDAAPLLRVLHVDRWLAAVDKQAGLLSAVGRGPDKRDSVETRVPRVFPEATGSIVVHRLDQPTSGVLVVALDADTHRALRRQFEQHVVHKTYVAELVGDVRADEGEVQLPFRLDPDNRPHQVHDPVHGKLGITRWRVLSRAAGRTRVLFTPRTGRTHQLRVHSAHPLGLGCPIAGDRLYGDPSTAPRLMLHAWQLTLTHPHTGAPLTLEAPLPF
jgi:tRNA pseudouridine32 synthase/23S rRNA pseudouridine746 synthase